MVQLPKLKQVRQIKGEEFELKALCKDSTSAYLVASIFTELGHRYRIFDTVIPYTDIPEYRVYISKENNRGNPNGFSRRIYKCKECGAEMTYRKKKRKIIFKCSECDRCKKIPLSHFP